MTVVADETGGTAGTAGMDEAVGTAGAGVAVGTAGTGEAGCALSVGQLPQPVRHRFISDRRPGSPPVCAAVCGPPKSSVRFASCRRAPAPSPVAARSTFPANRVRPLWLRGLRNRFVRSVTRRVAAGVPLSPGHVPPVSRVQAPVPSVVPRGSPGGGAGGRAATRKSSGIA